MLRFCGSFVVKCRYDILQGTHALTLYHIHEMENHHSGNLNNLWIRRWRFNTGVQSQKAKSAYVTSKQILPLVLQSRLYISTGLAVDDNYNERERLVSLPIKRSFSKYGTLMKCRENTRCILTVSWADTDLSNKNQEVPHYFSNRDFKHYFNVDNNYCLVLHFWRHLKCCIKINSVQGTIHCSAIIELVLELVISNMHTEFQHETWNPFWSYRARKVKLQTQNAKIAINVWVFSLYWTWELVTSNRQNNFEQNINTRKTCNRVIDAGNAELQL